MADTNPFHVHLRHFSGLPNENWDKFEGLLPASIAVSRKSEKPTTWGHKISLYALKEMHWKDLYHSLKELRNRYTGAKQKDENSKSTSNLQSSTPLKNRQPITTQLQRISNLATIRRRPSRQRSEERHWGIREQSNRGMPFTYKVLKKNDNVPVKNLCLIIKRKVRIDQMHSKPSQTPAFNLDTRRRKQPSSFQGTQRDYGGRHCFNASNTISGSTIRTNFKPTTKSR